MMGNKIKVLVLSPFYLPGYKGGGPIKTLNNLFQSCSETVAFKLIANDRDLGDLKGYSGIEKDGWNTVGPAQVFYVAPGLIGLVKIAHLVSKNRNNILYLNSLFSFRFSGLPLLIARLRRQKVILGPRGELSQGALDIKKIKKSAFLWLFRSCQFHRAITFQASSDFEADDIRRVFGKQVDIVIAENIAAQEFAPELPAREHGMFRAVFLSRISPKKNLLGALDILSRVTTPLTYHVYGPIEDLGYWSQCQSVIASLPSNVQVEYKGVLNPEDIVRTLTQYDAFFLPTKGENYGHVIVEASCAGLPLLISDTTPWRDLERLGVGWDLPLDQPDAFSDALETLSTTLDDEHKKMREKVLAWAQQRFLSRNAVKANIEMFRYIDQVK